MKVHAPQTYEGRRVWDLAMACGGQLRVSDGQIIGYDMAAVLAMAEASGVPRMAVVEFMPLIEAQAVAAFREEAEAAMKRGGADG